MKIKTLLASLLGVLLLCSCERAIIPESRFISIYHDLFLADSYIGTMPSLNYNADSLVAYQGIIESHGYSVEQFLEAQNFYIAHPEDFAKMMKRLQQQLISEKKELEASMSDTVEIENSYRKPTDL